MLADMIGSGAVPTVRLTKIFRQAASSKIIVNAHRINQGRMPEPSGKAESDFYFVGSDTPEDIHDKLMQVVTERIPKRFGLDPVNDVQVLTPMNHAGLGARSLNVELQQRLNPNAAPRVKRFGWTYAPGDKVIQNVNNYDKEVFNGDIGRVARIDEEEGLVFIDHDGRRIEYETGELGEVSLASCHHGPQQSGFGVSGGHHSAGRAALYAAGAEPPIHGGHQGKKLVVVIGQAKALAMAVERLGSVKRLTDLQHRLQRTTGGQTHGI